MACFLSIQISKTAPNLRLVCGFPTCGFSTFGLSSCGLLHAVGSGRPAHHALRVSAYALSPERAFALRLLSNPSPWRLRTVRAGRPPSAYAVPPVNIDGNCDTAAYLPCSIGHHRLMRVRPCRTPLRRLFCLWTSGSRKTSSQMESVLAVPIFLLPGKSKFNI